MIQKRKSFVATLALAVVSASAQAQVQDMLTTFDAGGSAMGMGGSLQVTTSDTLSSYYNPAGLGYINSHQFGLNYRNLPKSFTASTGSYQDRVTLSNGTPGPKALSHIGLAFPIGKIGKHKSSGVLGISYTVGGQLDDQESSNLLTVTPGVLGLANYTRDRSSQSDFINLAYGQVNSAQTMSFGVAFDYLKQHTSLVESGTFVDGSNNPTGANLNTNLSDDGYGYGATIGVQGLASGRGNASWGASYRTPIEIKGADNTSSEYGRIPGRLLGGLAFRQDNLRGGRDYAVFGAQVGYYSGGKSSANFDRSTSQTTVGVGMEYSIVNSAGRIPLRLGYLTVPSGGSGFAARNTFTYGLGYRPMDNKFALDANFAAPQNGGFDASFTLSLRFDQ